MAAKQTFTCAYCGYCGSLSEIMVYINNCPTGSEENDDMMKSSDGGLNDSSVHLLQKALYVEPLHYPLDLDKFPTNGHEYIHKVRLEEASYFPEAFNDVPEDFTMCFPEKTSEEDDSKKVSLSLWKRREASNFSRLGSRLKSKKQRLIKKFPQKSSPPVVEGKDWCLFCLGSDDYKKIYKEENVEDVTSNLPYLSIVLYLSQEDIPILLEHMQNWVDVIGMTHPLCRWIYSLLACVFKPLDDDCETFLEEFYDHLFEKVKVCDSSQKNQYHLILSILRNYFCIKAYQIGPSLDQFAKLC